MKQKLIFLPLTLALTLLLIGCIAAGTGPKTQNYYSTAGQQLIDLKKARDIGAINDQEYQDQKAKVLGQ